MGDDKAVQALLERIDRLHEIGVALSSERDSERLLELIVDSARELTGADGGTLYLVHEDRTVRFEIVRTHSLGFALGGTSGEAVPFPPLALETDGEPNRSMVVTNCVLNRQTIRIADAYHAEGFDFSGTRAFDQRTGYRTQSLLTVPMCDHAGEVIGVLQLINATRDGQVVAFESTDQRLVESLASQAAIALSNKRLIDQQRALFEALIRLIAEAIDEKSPHTAAHCRRVPELTMLLADAAHATEQGALADFTLSPNERYALYIAAWLHDCGKITTPEHVIDKAAKLEGVRDRMEEVANRFAVIRQQIHGAAECEAVRGEASGDRARAQRARAERDRQCAELDDELDYLRRVNACEVAIDGAAEARVRAIAERRWTDAEGQQRPLLSDDEVENLCIVRGNLNAEERRIIEQHAVTTIHMLEQLPFPRHLRNVPEYAACHHERVDGRGYPQGLTREQMSIPARAMAIADVFEALSAADRPYKPAKPLSQCLGIMRAMRDEGHIDPDLFEVFVREGVFERYAEAHLDSAQIEPLDREQFL